MFEETTENLSACISSDIIAADLRWSLFVSATKSYRYDSILRPYPPAYLKSDGKEKDIEKLRFTLSQVLPFTIILKDHGNFHSMDPDVYILLNWCLMCDSFSLCQKDKELFTTIKKLTGQVVSTPAPTHIFEVVRSNKAEKRFQEARNGRDIIYAYHGSRLENFHSILYNGLVSHLNKNSLFGSGTYLSSELSVSLPYSPTGIGWENSLLGPKFSCVAVCELIDDPGVKYNVKGDSNASRCYSSDSIAGIIPEKYYLVQNNDLIRVKYLLLYASHARNSSGNHSVQRNSSWWKKNRVIIILILMCSIFSCYWTLLRVFSSTLKKIGKLME